MEGEKEQCPLLTSIQWFDPKSGLAAALFVQLLPPGDAVVAELLEELEKAVYKSFADAKA